jgi:hypothetical protein
LVTSKLTMTNSLIIPMTAKMQQKLKTVTKIMKTLPTFLINWTNYTTLTKMNVLIVSL